MTNTNPTAAQPLDLAKLAEIANCVRARGLFNESCDILYWIQEVHTTHARAAQPESATNTTEASVPTWQERSGMREFIMPKDAVPHMLAEIADLRAQLAAKDQDDAFRDAVAYGTGILKDGKHIPYADLYSAPASAQPDRGAVLTTDQIDDIIQAVKMSMNFGTGIFFPRGWNVLLDKLHVMRDTASMASQPVAPADHDEAVLLLSAVFDAWENGDPCHEDGDPSGAFMGMAFRLDDDVFNRCCSLLNRLNPPRNAVAPSDTKGIDDLNDIPRYGIEHYGAGYMFKREDGEYVKLRDVEDVLRAQAEHMRPAPSDAKGKAKELVAAMRDRVARIRYIDESSRKLLIQAADFISNTMCQSMGNADAASAGELTLTDCVACNGHGCTHYPDGEWQGKCTACKGTGIDYTSAADAKDAAAHVPEHIARGIRLYGQYREDNEVIAERKLAEVLWDIRAAIAAQQAAPVAKGEQGDAA